MTLSDKLVKIKEEILSIQEKTGIYNSVEIVAVTKTHPFKVIKDSYEAGFLSIGENRVQEASKKFESFEPMPLLKKRFIGHLQSNNHVIYVCLVGVVYLDHHLYFLLSHSFSTKMGCLDQLV